MDFFFGMERARGGDDIMFYLRLLFYILWAGLCNNVDGNEWKCLYVIASWQKSDTTCSFRMGVIQSPN
jgi:hypothetical protein